jgi:hypothetical protein
VAKFFRDRPDIDVVYGHRAGPGNLHRALSGVSA